MSNETGRGKYGFAAAISVVVANMVGTGVFTTLGFQLLEIQSGFVILMLWAVGGVTAFCGAVSYAELGAALPRSGGEYHFVSRIYHPAAGFLSGWVSATVGFAAPVALAAITFAAYSLSAFGVEAEQGGLLKIIACSAVVFLAFIHAYRRRASGGLQTVFTAIKVLLIAAFCIGVAFFSSHAPISFAPTGNNASLIFSGSFAVSLIFVSYAYAGWNAAAYLTGEIEEAQKNLPRILGIGALVVAVLYVLLNASFLAAAPMDAMAGKIEIGYIAAEHAFGAIAAKFAGLVLALLLFSTISAMTIAGPRVLQAMGEDYPVFSVLARTNKDGLPVTAILLQAAAAILFILTSTFQAILVFAGALVALNSFLTVVGLFVLRWKEPGLDRPYRVFFYPVAPLVYLGITGWTLAYVAATKPAQALAGAGLLGVGGIVYILASQRRRAA